MIYTFDNSHSSPQALDFTLGSQLAEPSLLWVSNTKTCSSYCLPHLGKWKIYSFTWSSLSLVIILCPSLALTPHKQSVLFSSISEIPPLITISTISVSPKPPSVQNFTVASQVIFLLPPLPSVFCFQYSSQNDDVTFLCFKPFEGFSSSS